MNLYSVFVHIHSGLRWLVFIFILAAIVIAAVRLSRKAPSNQKDCVINRLVLIFTHLQLVLGLVLYFISPKVVFEAASMKSGMLRFFLVEHISLMIIAVVLITIGYIKSDRAEEGAKKHKQLIVYYSVALLLILAAIPWPFRGLGAGWF
jgi:membrane protein DedA with SNARE-associated domain